MLGGRRVFSSNVSRRVSIALAVVAASGSALAQEARPMQRREPVKKVFPSIPAPAPEPTPPPPATTAPPKAPPPAPARPPTPLTRWERTFASVNNVAAGSRGGPTAACTDGRVVAGGTGDIGIDGRVITRQPVADGSGYLVVGQNDVIAPGGLARVGAAAVCIGRPEGYAIIQTTRTLAPKERATTELTCPAGSVVIGGGASAAFDVFTVSSAPKLDGSAWVAYFRNDAVFANQAATTYAVCAAASAVAGRQIVSSAPMQIGPGAVAGGPGGSLSLQCPAGKKALSIGIASSASTVNQGWVNFLPTGSNIKPPGTWEGGIKNTSGLDNVTAEVRLIAICASSS